MKELVEIYKKYKQQILPLAFMLFSIFILFRVIIPQFSTISETNNLIISKKEELSVLNNSLKIIESADRDQVARDFGISTTALPTAKDIVKIFSALTSATAKSDTELKEFSLKIGGLYGKIIENTSQVIGAPDVAVVANVQSENPANFIEFARELSKTLPLSEIKKINTTGNLGVYEISFYYKPLDLTLVSKSDKVQELSQADKNLLNELSGWRN